MASRAIEKNDIFVSAAQSNEEIFIITGGAVIMSAPGIKITLEKGDVIGACEVGFESHYLSYMATEDATVVSYQLDDLDYLLKKKSDFSAFFYKSLQKQILAIIFQYSKALSDTSEVYEFAMKTYESYKKYCKMLSKTPKEFDEIAQKGEYIDTSDTDDSLIGYYEQMDKVLKDGRLVSPDFLINHIKKTSKDARGACLASKKAFAHLVTLGNFFFDDPSHDLYGFMTDLYFEALKVNAEVALEILDNIRELEELLNYKTYINPNRYLDRTFSFGKKIDTSADKQPENEDEAKILEETKDSLEFILQYSGVEEKIATDFRALMNSYKQLKDKASMDDSVRHIRLDIANLFYKIYEAVFFVATTDALIPKVIRMFLEFGFMDETLCSKSDLILLYEKAGSGYSSPHDGIYTLYEWMEAIYSGKKLPSKNEFDVDYETFVHEKKVKNQITAEMEKKMMADKKAMVLYEMHNMFISANKVTFGRISIFMPVFTSENLLKKVSSSLIDKTKIHKALDNITKADFTVYYRENLYKNEKLGINEYVNVEILPDVILMPNVGTRAILWQEIQGRVRTTPSRMVIPVIDMENVESHFLHMTGEYRWEMCKRIQGARWNDVSDPSLTSEYFDYVQFYKKNHELSPEAKERIKSNLQKAKNSFKEMFIMDYMQYVLYESDGSPRLNKVSRSIMTKYCPFPKEIRKNLISNPTYKECIGYYENHHSPKAKRFDNLILKLQNSGVTVPKELKDEQIFLNS